MLTKWAAGASVPLVMVALSLILTLSLLDSGPFGANTGKAVPGDFEQRRPILSRHKQALICGVPGDAVQDGFSVAPDHPRKQFLKLEPPFDRPRFRIDAGNLR